jgi:hypothetical protein
MLVVNNHQAGSGDSDLQQRVWLAMQAMRVRYPVAQGIIGGDWFPVPCLCGRDKGHVGIPTCNADPPLSE